MFPVLPCLPLIPNNKMELMEWVDLNGGSYLFRTKNRRGNVKLFSPRFGTSGLDLLGNDVWFYTTRKNGWKWSCNEHSDK
jgi:hypothetical protein